MVDRSLHSISSSKRFRRRSVPQAPPPAETEQKGSVIPWVVLVGIAVVGLKWWQDKNRLEQAEQKGQRLTAGTASGLFSWLNMFRRQRKSLQFRGKVGRASAGAGTQTSTDEQNALSDQSPPVSTSGSPAVYDKASLQMFAEGKWSMIARHAAVRLTDDDTLEMDVLHQLHITGSGQTITAPVTTDLSLRGSASDKTVKFKADGLFWSLEFPAKKNFEAFMADFEAKLQHNKAAMSS